MKTELTPLQELYWKREKLLSKLQDKRINSKTMGKIIAEIYTITCTMNKMEEERDEN